MNQVPINNTQQQLVYKQVGHSVNDLIFFPPLQSKQPKAPLLLLIPGGGWQRNESISMYNMAKPAAETLRENGFAVATISYRGQQADSVSMREIVADIYDALGYLAKYSDMLSIDPEHFYTMGHSAGAHLSLMAAYDADRVSVESELRQYMDTFTVRAVAAIAPPTFFAFENRQLYSPIDITPIFKEETPDEYRRFSPLLYADSHSPATYLASGDKDDLISCVQADLLYKKLLLHNVKAKLTLSKGGDHCCMPAPEEAAAVPDLPVILQEAADFILQCEQ